MENNATIDRVENLYTKDCIRTRSGIYMNVFNPIPEMVCLEDIAHALSMMPRFGGHLPEFYSVAQHSVLVSQHVKEGNELSALLHDASEAYLMDFPSPIKKRISEYKLIEAKLMIVIGSKFGFDYRLNEDIKRADELLLQWEWGYLMLGQSHFPEIKCLPPAEARQMFMDRFFEIHSDMKQLNALNNGK